VSAGISPTDPAARYTASANSVAGYAYSDGVDDARTGIWLENELCQDGCR
jgi:hypothetical protein